MSNTTRLLAVTRNSTVAHNVDPNGYLTCRPIEGQRGMGAGAWRAINPDARDFNGKPHEVDCKNCIRILAKRGV